MFILFLIQMVMSCDGGLVPFEKGMLFRDMDAKGGIQTKEEFLEVVQNFENKMGKWVEKEFDHELVVYKSWSTNTVNAFAEQENKKFMITVYGGLARYESMTRDSLSLTLCHELGHHIGGAPKKTGNKWSSAEGQADYFATMKCLKQLWNDEEYKIPQNANQFLIKKCEANYTSKHEVELCMRTALAGKQMALLFQFLDHESFTPEFNTPDPKVVSHTELMHPYAQCRLDTYFQGSLCDRPFDELMDDYNERKGVCEQGVGSRPLCWYHPR